MTKAWLTRMTGGALFVSLSRMSRPATSAVPNVVSHPGVIALKFDTRWRSGSSTPPGTSIRLFQVLPLTGVTNDAAAAADAGNSRDTLTDAIVCRQTVGRRNLGPLRVDGDEQHAVAIEAEVHVRQRAEGPHEQPGGDDEHDRERDLRDDEPARQADSRFLATSRVRVP